MITDNLFIASKIFSFFENNTHYHVNISYAISPNTNISKFKHLLGDQVFILNLKNEEEISYILKKYNLIFSAHCKQLFPKSLYESVTCINIHPGYNPYNRGWYPQVFSIINKTKVGATIHLIDSEIDHGEIIDRVEVEQYLSDTSLELYNRIIDAEIYLFEKNISRILENNFSTFLPEFEGSVNLKKDFKDLCFIDGNIKVTAFDLIDKLRALSHADFKNAYFINPETNKKIYISINLTEEK